MKKILLTTTVLCAVALAGCSSDSVESQNTSGSVPSVVAQTEAPDPLLELLKEPASTPMPTPAPAYMLEKQVFLQKYKEMNGVLIDLRMPEEIAKVPMLDPAAKNLDFYGNNLIATYFGTADKSKTYFLYDTTGVNAETIYNALQKIGFTSVYVLKGGVTK